MVEQREATNPLVFRPCPDLMNRSRHGDSRRAGIAKKTASSIRIPGCWPVFCAPLSPERRGRPMNGTLSPPTVSEVAPKPSSKNLYDGHERTQAQPLKNIPVSPSGTVCWLTMRERHRSREPLQRLEGAFRPHLDRRFPIDTVPWRVS